MRERISRRKAIKAGIGGGTVTLAGFGGYSLLQNTATADDDLVRDDPVTFYKATPPLGFEQAAVTIQPDGEVRLEVGGNLITEITDPIWPVWDTLGDYLTLSDQGGISVVDNSGSSPTAKAGTTAGDDILPYFDSGIKFGRNGDTFGLPSPPVLFRETNAHTTESQVRFLSSGFSYPGGEGILPGGDQGGRNAGSKGRFVCFPSRHSQTKVCAYIPGMQQYDSKSFVPDRAIPVGNVKAFVNGSPRFNLHFGYYSDRKEGRCIVFWESETERFLKDHKKICTENIKKLLKRAYSWLRGKLASAKNYLSNSKLVRIFRGSARQIARVVVKLAIWVGIVLASILGGS